MNYTKTKHTSKTFKTDNVENERDYISESSSEMIYVSDENVTIRVNIDNVNNKYQIDNIITLEVFNTTREQAKMIVAEMLSIPVRVVHNCFSNKNDNSHKFLFDISYDERIINNIGQNVIKGKIGYDSDFEQLVNFTKKSKHKELSRALVETHDNFLPF